MEINGNLTTSVFLSSMAKTSSINNISTHSSNPVVNTYERDLAPEKRVDPLTKISQGLRDVNDGITLLQDVNKGYQALTEGIEAIKALATAATDDELSNKERFDLNNSAQKVKESLFDEADTPKFNRISLLDQSSSSVAFRISVTTEGNFEVGAFDIESLFQSVGLDDIDLSSVEKAEESLKILESLEDEIESADATISESYTRLSDYVSNLSYSEGESLGSFSPVEISTIANDANSFIQDQITRDDAAFLQIYTSPDSRKVLGLLKS